MTPPCGSHGTEASAQLQSLSTPEVVVAQRRRSGARRRLDGLGNNPVTVPGKGVLRCSGKVKVAPSKRDSLAMCGTEQGHCWGVAVTWRVLGKGAASLPGIVCGFV